MSKYLFNGSITHAYHEDGISDLCLDNQIKSDISCFRHKIQTNKITTQTHPGFLLLPQSLIWIFDLFFSTTSFVRLEEIHHTYQELQKYFGPKTQLSSDHRIPAAGGARSGPASQLSDKNPSMFLNQRSKN